MRQLVRVWLCSSFAILGLAAAGIALAQQPLKIGIVTFLSGPAAGPFGVPARNAAEVVIENLNAGKLPAPYATKGFGGASLEITFIDEAGPSTKQVADFRNLAQRVDLVIGYISSGNCLAVAPVAEELKKLTVFFDCGTPRIFEDANYKYVFRTQATATMDSVGAALYVTDRNPKTKAIAGINQNYAWGQDSWNDFEAAMKVLRPGIEVKTSQMPKLFAGQFGAEISTLLASNADFIHSSLWGGDLEAFVLQAAPRDLFKKSTVVLTAGETAMFKLADKIPDGTVLGARGMHGVLAPASELNKWFRAAYEDRFQLPPVYPAYHMTQAILGTKAAYEKAQAANGGKAPSQEQIIAAFENLTFEAPSGKVQMALGKGHQAVQGTAYGTTRLVKGHLTITDIKAYPPEKVNPPEGVKSEDWIKSGFKAK
ncbi:MAG: ABC transporter substrate-binding protein [Burkholderiales bacterium]